MDNETIEKKEKQKGLSTTPEAHFSAVQIPFPLAVLPTYV
jgi:hypothetical protein